MKNEITKDTDGLDIIGDIHGYAAELHALLAKLGYEERDGAHRHPQGRRAIFLGDWIDRGPQAGEVLRVVRAMHAAGSALAVPGNHEFNALAYATDDGNGGRLRKCDEGHDVTLDHFAGREHEWRGHCDWFRTLPLWIELPGLRAVHAAWDPRLAMALRGRTMDDALVRAAHERGTPERAGIQVLLKGIEVPLPDGHFFSDRKGTPRHKIRTKWWLGAQGRTFRGIALQPEADPSDLPELPADEHGFMLPGYATDERPVFNGHYWLEGEPAPMAPNVAILDYSVARGGALTAYRWDGERRLVAGKFVQVQAESAPGQVDGGSPNR